MITADYLRQQIVVLETQKLQGQAAANMASGAIQLAEHLIDRIEGPALSLDELAKMVGGTSAEIVLRNGDKEVLNDAA